jgi:hypothetical protein
MISYWYCDIQADDFSYKVHANTEYVIYVQNALLYRIITNDVSIYINLLVRITHIICNHTLQKLYGHL